MFDSMGSALKKHIGKIKVKGHPLEGSAAEEKLESKSEEQKEQTDNAPEIGEDGPGLKHHMAQPHMPMELGPEHIELLKQLIDQIGHQGREPMGLEERAHVGMKDKMASLMGHKK